MSARQIERDDLRGPAAGVFVLVAGLLVATAVGFYAPYLSRVPRFEGSGWPVHLHVLTVCAWLAMLCVQAWLGRAGRSEAHRRLGHQSPVDYERCAA